MKIYSEITPLRNDVLFTIEGHKNARFDYPIHLHPEFEINLVMNSSGRRVVGDSVSEYEQTDLVLLGPNLLHKWESSEPNQTKSSVITVQFHKDLMNNELLSKNSLKHIQTLLKNSQRGICFYGNTREIAIKQLKKILHLDHFNATIEFISLLNTLASSTTCHFLASIGFNLEHEFINNRQIHKVYNYVLENYKDESLSLKKVAERNNMSVSAFSHFFKKRINKNFTQFVIDFRITQAIKSLQETNYTIKEICFDCGFNNISNFNRIFKKRINTTPSEYRKTIQKFNDINISQASDKKYV